MDTQKEIAFNNDIKWHQFITDTVIQTPTSEKLIDTPLYVFIYFVNIIARVDWEMEILSDHFSFGARNKRHS